MAEVFLAKNRAGEICAIKRILPHLAQQESFIRMFIDEARIVSRLRHPNVAAVYDHGQHDGFYFIAMEYVAGRSLLAVHEKAAAARMPLPHGLLSYVVAELLAALEAAHTATDDRGQPLGIVHRDVTPQNIIISYDGAVKLIDFGVALARARLTQTEAGFTKGKLAYMSPEQARGDKLDARSDIFSAGVVLWEITTGRRLFDRDGPGGTLHAVVNDEIPAPSSFDRHYPKALERIVLRALERDRSRRWDSAGAMREALLSVVAEEHPPPGADRLRTLIRDLFGAPEPLEAMASVVAPSPSVEDPRSEETRLLVEPSHAEAPAAPALEAAPDRRPSGDRAAAGRPASSDPAASGNLAASIAVPAASTPLWARAWRAVDRAGLRVARWFWRRPAVAWTATFLIAIGLVAGGGYTLGAWSRLGRWFGGAAEKVRDMKAAGGVKQAGAPDEGADAGPKAAPVIAVRSDPPGAQVWVDGRPAGGVTPLTVPGPFAGPVVLEFRLLHFERAQIAVDPADQAMTEVDVRLTRRRTAVSIGSEPDGAEVWLGDRSLGSTPLAVELPLGVVSSLRLTRPGYEEATVEVSPKSPDDPVLVMEKLRRVRRGGGMARLRVESTPRDCPCWVNGAAVGRTPVGPLDVPSGRAAVTVRCLYREELHRTVRLRAGRKEILRLAPRPTAFGYLSLDVEPPGEIVVRVDGRSVAYPVAFLKLPAGKHRVEVQHLGLGRRQRLVVNLEPDARVRRRIRLF